MQRLIVDSCRAKEPCPTLYLMVGLPGAGKTTRALELETRHSALRISLDAWMIPLFAGVNEDTSRDLLEGLLISLALQALRFGTSVVLDFGLWSRNERSSLRYLAAAIGADSEVVYMEVDRVTQLRRVTTRYKKAPEQTFAMTQEELDQWRVYFESPDQNELAGMTLDEPPTGFVTWPAWASTRWLSFDDSSDILRCAASGVALGAGDTAQILGVRRGDSIPTLTLFCGLPGSGKTTLAKGLEVSGRGVRICTDDWYAQLSAGDADTELHERIQVRLYQCALDLLRHGVDVILEDGLWVQEEREQKFNDARASGARIELHAFDVALTTLWTRLRRRNAENVRGDYRMTYNELRRAASLFEPLTSEELAFVDTYVIYDARQS